MYVSLIVAMAENRVIGVNNSLPWSLPDDLRHFRALTLGKPVLMGRKTYESIGRPLPKRHNIVLTRDRAYRAPGCSVVGSVQEALEAAGEADELMVIGGATLYRRLLPTAQCVYLTEVHASVEGDTWFPDLAGDEWEEVAREERAADAENPLAHAFVTYQRRASPA